MAKEDAHGYVYENVGIPSDTSTREGSAYTYGFTLTEAATPAVYFYANVGVPTTATQEGVAYFYENVGPVSTPTQEGVAYFYENVITGGGAALIGTSRLHVRQDVPGGVGGYGTEPYGEFRYGMGEEEEEEVVGAAADLFVEATFAASGSVAQTGGMASWTTSITFTPTGRAHWFIAASMGVEVNGLDGPTPLGPTPRSEVCIPPWPDTIVLRPLKGGAGHRSDSAALCADGRVIYCWINGDILNQCHYPTIEDYAAADNESATAGNNLAPSFGIYQPSATVWRHYGTGHLFLFVAGWRLTDSRNVIRVYRSMSGNGESAPGVPDWTLWSTIQDVEHSQFSKHNGERTTGEPYVTPNGRWLWTGPEFQEWQGLWSSDDYGRTWTYRQRLGHYMFGGAYGYGMVRNIVFYQGKYWFSSSGNVDPAKGAYSSDNGTTWTTFAWPGTTNSDLAQILTVDETGMYVAFGGIFYADGGPGGLEITPDPPNTSRANRVKLIPGFPGSLHGILQRVGDCDYYMVSGQILLSAPKGWGVGQVRMG